MRTLLLGAGLGTLALIADEAVATAAQLRVDPPPGHKVEKAQPDPGYTEAFDVNSTLDADAGCSAALQPVGPTGAVQADLNKIAVTAAYMETVRLFFSIRFDIAKVEPYKLDNIVGVRAAGTGKGAPDVSALATILETPKGRVTTVCVGPTARLDTLRPEFEAIMRGVVPPQ